MSRKKVCKVLHKIFIDKLEQEITAQISKALRADFANVKAVEGKLAQQVEIKRETLKKWYFGYNVPSAAHLVLLARSSPAVAETLTELFKNSDENDKIYGATRCTINGNIFPKALENLNQRQLWFLEMLQQQKNPKVKDMVKALKISLRTAKYDIAAMVHLGLIRFVGPKRTGRYEIC